MTRRTLVLGGTRSGKSAHAEGLLTDPVVTYVATARRYPGDTDWDRRIARHVERRPPTWTTVESPDLAKLLAAAAEDDPPLLVDDLATWLTGVLDDANAWEGDGVEKVERQCDALLTAASTCRARLVVVSAEVGLGVVPSTRSGRLFRDHLGSLNARLAEVCDEVLLLVAGIPLTLRSRRYWAVSTSEDTEPDFTFPPVDPPHEQVLLQALARLDTLTKPVGSLGKLEGVAAWVSSCQGVCPPRPFTRPRVVVFAGDHGIAKHGVSAYPSEVTAQMVANFLTGGAAVNVLATVAGATVRVVDIAVDGDTPDVVSAYKVRRGSGSIDREDALTREEAIAAITAGMRIADEEVDGGADLLIAGDMGIGNTTPAAVLIASLTGSEPVNVVGRGTGIDDAAWMRKTAAIRDALRRARKKISDPVALLATAGGADIAAMVGFLAQAAFRKTPVLLDGVVVSAAAVVAEELAPGAREWWKAGHRSAEPAHALALGHLSLEPLLEFDMRLGEGTGAVAALPLVMMATKILAEMATFDSAGISGKD